MRVLLTAWSAITTNRVRSLLTMVGVSIGIFSIYTLLTIGNGVTRTVTEVSESVFARTVSLSGVDPTPGKALNESDVVALSQLFGASNVIATTTASLKIVHNRSELDRTTVGTDSGYLAANGFSLTRGRNFMGEDNHTRASVVLIRRSLSDELFLNSTFIGEVLLINGLPFRIIGEFDNLDASDEDGPSVLVPRRTMNTRILVKTNLVPEPVETIIIMASNPGEVDNVERQVRRYIDATRGEDAFSASKFRIFTFSSIRDNLSQIRLAFMILLSSIGAITLLVGGIGVMNIMLVSVVERTPEIGLRMSVGARSSDILFQFIIEAITLCLIAGVFGVFLAVSVCAIINVFDVIPLAVSPSLIFLSLTFSAVVGLISGVAPAYRASKLNPVVALNAS